MNIPHVIRKYICLSLRRIHLLWTHATWSTAAPDRPVHEWDKDYGARKVKFGEAQWDTLHLQKRDAISDPVSLLRGVGEGWGVASKLGEDHVEMKKDKSCLFWRECRTGPWCVLPCEDLELVKTGERVNLLHVCDLYVW